MNETRLTYSDLEEELRDNVARLLSSREDLPALIVAMEEAPPFDESLWKSLDDEMGLAALIVPDDAGGSGAGPHELGVVMEEIGRHLAPVPYLGHAALACGLVTDASVACGIAKTVVTSTPAALAVPFSRGWTDPFPATVRWRDGRLDGTVPLVVDASHASVVLVPALGTDGPVIVATDAATVGRTPVTTLDLTRDLTDVSLDEVPGEVVAEGEDAVQRLTRATQLATVALACEQLGVAQRALDLSVEHAGTRVQFGRPIGSFQAVKHRLAEAWAEVTQARAVVRYAVDCLARQDDIPIAVALASSVCSATAVSVAETCLQIHGGVGFSWEHPAHLYVKRAKSNSLAFGPADAHLDVIAEHANLPAPVADPPDPCRKEQAS
ncbi:acyl-CoA dehydrogenase family protein [Streptomyces hirsutus]|uniref:acyl-CoA dehydrogenase family protein n=1 Tax=Streptomyces hirsutus TaxID=35620 RepID=UPI00364D7DF6